MTGHCLQQVSFVIFAGWLSTPAEAGTQPATGELSTQAASQTCLPSDKMRVFQILDDGILAYLCPPEVSVTAPICYTEGDLVYLPVKPSENDYVDDQKITLPVNKCFGADGVYSYYTRDKTKKRVRKIKIIDAQPVNQ